MPGGAIELARAQVVFGADFVAMITDMQRAQKQFQQVTKSMEASAKGVEKSSSSMARSAANAAKSVVAGYTSMQRAASQFLRNMTMTTVFLQLDVQYLTKLFRDLSKVSIAGLGLAVGSAAKFEDAFVQVVKVVDMSNVELERLSGNLRKMSMDVNVSAEALAEMAAMGGRLGIRGVENLTQFTQTVAELQIATNIAGEEGASSLARLMNIMGTSANDIHRLGSSITDLGNNLATTESEILDMALRLAGAGKTVGLTTAEVLGLAGAMSAVGLRAEMGGSAMSRVLINMSQAVSTNSAALSTFARTARMSTREFAALFRRDAVGALQAFISGLQQLDAAGRDVFGVLADVGASEIRVRDTLLRLFNASEMLGSAIDRSNNAWADNSALSREVARRNETLIAQAGMLWRSVVELARGIGDLYVPVLKDIVTWAKAVVMVFNDLDPAQKETIGRTLALVAAISTAIGILGSLATIMLTLGVGFFLLARLVTFFLNPWMLLIGGIGLGIFLLKQWDINTGEIIVNWLKNMGTQLANLKQYVSDRFVVEEVLAKMKDSVNAWNAEDMEAVKLDIQFDWSSLEESWEEFKIWIGDLELPPFPFAAYTIPEIDWTPAKNSWEAFKIWVGGLELPPLPITEYTMPEIDWSPVKNSWEEFVTWASVQQAPELPIPDINVPEVNIGEKTQSILDNIVANLAKSPGGQITINLADLIKDVMVGEKTFGQALMEAINSAISIPLTAGLISLLPLSPGWKLAIGGVILALSFVPGIDTNLKEVLGTFWQEIKQAFAQTLNLDKLLDTGTLLDDDELISPLMSTSIRLGYSLGEVIARTLATIVVDGVMLAPKIIGGAGTFVGAGVQIGTDILLGLTAGIAIGLVELPIRVGASIAEKIRNAIDPSGKEAMQDILEDLQAAETSFDPLLQASQALAALAGAISSFNIEGEQLAELLAEIQRIIDSFPEELRLQLRETGAVEAFPQLRFRSGAILPGTGGPDMFPALLAPGEAVVPAEAVQGGWGATLAWFRSMGVPGFQEGYVPDIAAAQTEAEKAKEEVEALAKMFEGKAGEIVAGIDQFNATVTGGIMEGAKYLAGVLKVLFPQQAEKIDEWVASLDRFLGFEFIRFTPPEEEDVERRPGMRGRVPVGVDNITRDTAARDFAMWLISFTSVHFPALASAAGVAAEWIVVFADGLDAAFNELEKFSGSMGNSLNKLVGIMNKFNIPGAEKLVEIGSTLELIGSVRSAGSEFAYELEGIRFAIEDLLTSDTALEPPWYARLGGQLGAGYIGSLAGGGGFRDSGTGINWIGSIAGGLAGMGIAPMLTGGIALGSQLVNALFPGEAKSEADQALQQRINDMNKELKDWGSRFQSANLSFRKDAGFLGWRNLFGNVKWETVGKEAAEEGAKIAERLLASMKNVFGALSPTVGQILFEGMTEDAFMANVGQQLQTALVEALLAEGPVKEAMQELSAMVAEAIEFGITDDAMDEIKKKAEEAFEAIEGYQEIADEITEAFGNANDEINQMIDRLGDQLRSAVTSAFRATSLEDFMDDIERQLLLRTRDAFIQAFIESAAMAPLFDSLSTAIGNAVRDGIIDAGEMDAIRDVISQIGESSAEFFQILDELGLSMEDLGETARGVSESLTNVPEGFRVALHRFNAMTPVELPVVPGIPGTGIPNTGIPNIGRPIWSADSVDTIPLAQTGGIVTRTGAVIVHAGEVIHNPERESGIGNNITMNITIVSNDPQKIYRELKKLIERENVVKYGTPVAPAPMFNR